jgi:hypothetical protein
MGMSIIDTSKNGAIYINQLKLQMLCFTATATLNVVLYERTICRVQIQKEVIFVLKRGNQFL